LIQKLPIQVHHTKEELASRSISELKALLKEEEKNINDDSTTLDRAAALFVEKKDLIEALLGGPTASRPHDSSAESCSICCEDYSCGDLKRVLPDCGHQFHVECIDRWLVSSTNYSRPASCPMCNTELKENA
jgi:E3 ubiquitin-protein ligase RNF38/44